MDDSLYEDHVRRSEIEYLAAFEEWENTLSDDDRRALRDAAAPDLDLHSRSQTGREKDVADNSSASEWPDISATLDSDGAKLAERFGLDSARGHELDQEISQRVKVLTSEVEALLLARIAAIFCESPNPKLASVALSFCAGLNCVYNLGPSIRAYAKTAGVSAAAISKLAVRWIDELGLKNTQHLRNPELREIYREAQLKRHWRKRNEV